MSDFSKPANHFRRLTWTSMPGAAGLIREPLLHFLLIGAFLFGIGHFIGTGRDPGRVISVTPEVRQRLIQEFSGLQSRPPTEIEYDRLVKAWIQNETLFREAIALKLDSGDEMIRQRLVQKMQILVLGRVTVPKPSDGELGRYLETHRAEFDIPARIDFFEVTVGGADAEAQGKAYLAEIAAGTEPVELRSRARVFANRSPAMLAEVFGKAFADTLIALPPHVWSLVRSNAGMHLVRVDTLRAAQPASLAAIRSTVQAAWTEDRRRELVANSLRELSASYDIRGEGAR